MNATLLGASALSAFPFTTSQIRACLIEDQCWFVAKDVFTALDIRWNGTNSLNKIKPEWRGVSRFHTPHINQSGATGIEQEQELLIIAEPAVYKIAFRSDKPEAERFTDRIAEIVTEIRKTGRYVAPAAPAERYIDLTRHDEVRRLFYIINRMFYFEGSAAHNGWAAMRRIGGGATATSFPESKLPQALAALREIHDRTGEFFKIKAEFEKQAILWVFGKSAEMIQEPNLPTLGEQLKLQ